MSSSLSREPLTGVIRQDAKVVGAICLPEEAEQDFIEQFNHCYGPLRLHIESAGLPEASPTMIVPVGAALRCPLRPPAYPSKAPNRDTP